MTALLLSLPSGLSLPELPAWLNTRAPSVSTAMAMPDASEQTDHDESARLVAASLDGDDHAFAELVRRHKSRILRLVARFARTPADIDELAQDVFIKAHRSLPLYRADGPFEHWLCRIATRCCQDYLRRLYRRRWFTSLEWLRETTGDQLPAHAAEDSRLELLRLALARLKPDQQTLLVLLDIEGHGVRETALFTGLSESNVKIRAHRARARLREIVQRLEAAENRA